MRMLTLATSDLEAYVELGVKVAIAHLYTENKITKDEAAKYKRTLKIICRESSTLSKLWKKIWKDVEENSLIISLAIIQDPEEDLPKTEGE